MQTRAQRTFVVMLGAKLPSHMRQNHRSITRSSAAADGWLPMTGVAKQSGLGLSFLRLSSTSSLAIRVSADLCGRDVSGCI